MGRSFDRLSTVVFQKEMMSLADSIYLATWPGCTVNRYSRGEGEPHVLDQAYGVDMELVMPSGQTFTVQEKFRRHKFLVEPNLQVEPPTPDFTQEFKNAAGTEQETDGEWFHLAAQFYFYGWASEDCSRFEKWVILDVPKYKMLVEERGGLSAIGELFQNDAHGRASFYAIPVTRLWDAWLYTHAGPAERLRTIPK